MRPVDFLGLIATIVSIVSFTPQVIRSWQTKQTKDLSISSLHLLLLGTGLWATYGVFRQDFAVITANSIIFCLVLILRVLKSKYG